MAVMTNTRLVGIAREIANNYKTLYVYGCFGAPMNATNKKRYSNNCDYNRQPARKNKILNASSDTFGFDCVNLIKGILWGWNGNVNDQYGGAKYKANGVPDENANDMFNSYCYDKTNNFSNIMPGEFVWMKGHIGIYIGDGLAIECTPIWKDGVQITAVGNMGGKTGYNKRTWTSHGKSKFIEYEQGGTMYQAHIQNIGWQGWRINGQTAGTTGQSLRMEAIRIDSKKEIYAKAHIQDIGWVDYGKINKDTIIGTTGQNKRLECLCLKGNFKYRVHIANVGWSTWTNADGICTLGSVGQDLGLEAIQIIEL